MPIYEFYCSDCHAIFQFFSRSFNTDKRPACPACQRPGLSREVSRFAITGKAKSPDEQLDDLPIDETRMMHAMEQLAGEAESINDEDPRQAANLMRRFAHLSGMPMGDAMEEAIARMEQGEDPDAIEADMGDRLDTENPFACGGSLKSLQRTLRAPRRDETLYDL